MQSWKRSFYQSFFKLYIVLTFQNVITLSVNLADNMMLGAYSEISLSAAAAVNQVQFIYQQIPGAFGGGIVNAFLIGLSIIFVPMSYQMQAKDGLIIGGGSPKFVMKLIVCIKINKFV